MSTCTLTIDYPEEVLWALRQEPAEFEQQARLLLALALYRSGKLSTGLAARLAGMARVAFMLTLGQYGLSPFGESASEIEEDLRDARQARNI
jgi:predicted HTH domain antitoxin